MDIENVFLAYTGMLDSNYAATLLELGADASDWYEKASQDIVEFAHAFDIEPETAAAVIAILSPRVQVSRNARLAAKYLLDGETEGIMEQRLKAIERYVRYGFLNGYTHGHKVYAFYRNLSGDFSHVTVDTWMAKIYGVDFQKITDQQRLEIQHDVTAMAVHAGITPAAAQAALWVGYRELNGHNDSEGALSMVEITEGVTSHA